MAISDLIHENVKVESLELFIIKTLLKGKNVVIPDFGHLEVKLLGERRTVLFKSSRSEDSFLQAMSTHEEKERSNIFALYNAISIPLKEEKLVNLPQIGVFCPIKRGDSEIQVSFMPYSSLRKLLYEEGGKVEDVENKVENKKDEIKAEVYIYENKKDRTQITEVTNKKDEREVYTYENKRDRAQTNEIKDRRDEREVYVYGNKRDRAQTNEVTDRRDEREVYVYGNTRDRAQTNEITDRRDERGAYVYGNKRDSAQTKEVINRRDDREVYVYGNTRDRAQTNEITDRRDDRGAYVYGNTRDRAQTNEITDRRDDRGAYVYGNTRDRAQANEVTDRRDDREAYVYGNKRDRAQTNEITDRKEGWVKNRILDYKEFLFRNKVNKDNATLKSNTSVTEKEPLKSIVVESEDDDTKKAKRNRLILLASGAMIVLLVISVMAMRSHYSSGKKDDQAKLVPPSESVNLPSLAEQHYGNSVFWIYIYEANKDKLTSPVNIPKNVSLVIPDLKTDYDVDVTDSLEIQRANILADIILNKKENK